MISAILIRDSEYTSVFGYCQQESGIGYLVICSTYYLYRPARVILLYEVSKVRGELEGGEGGGE